jgi:hypothetical protein
MPMNHRGVMKSFIKLMDILKLTDEREDIYVSWVRGFKPGEDYLARYRFRPCAPMLAFIYERVSEFDEHAFDLMNAKL